MSAYGTIPRPTLTSSTPLLPRTYRANSGSFVTVFPTTLSTVPRPLLAHLHTIFNSVVEEGRTYPQEFVLDEKAFEEYYFSYDCFVALVDVSFSPTTRAVSEEGDSHPAWDRPDAPSLASLLGGNVTEAELKSKVVGMYYVKPNYPGRSSHCCNAGFVVSPAHRASGYGYVLGKSYLHFAPKLGYLASVFNLVYANNTASLKIWDKLGFTRAGLIPRAGRLRTKDGKGEEFVDAVVFWRSFVEDQVWEERVKAKELLGTQEGLHEV